MLAWLYIVILIRTDTVPGLLYRFRVYHDTLLVLQIGHLNCRTTIISYIMVTIAIVMKNGDRLRGKGCY